MDHRLGDCHCQCSMKQPPSQEPIHGSPYARPYSTPQSMFHTCNVASATRLWSFSSRLGPTPGPQSRGYDNVGDS
eukprot:1142407-Pelagomonas_calceolata.AAC.3